jgi:hypothetical protein
MTHSKEALLQLVTKSQLLAKARLAALRLAPTMQSPKLSSDRS